MKTFRAVSILASAFVLTTIAHAKDICVISSVDPAPTVFRKVKKLKPGSAIALNGFHIRFTDRRLVPVSGTALMQRDGTVLIGIFLHAMGLSGQEPTYYERMTTDTTFEGTGYYDNNADARPDGVETWSSVSCKDITLP